VWPTEQFEFETPVINDKPLLLLAINDSREKTNCTRCRTSTQSVRNISTNSWCFFNPICNDYVVGVCNDHDLFRYQQLFEIYVYERSYNLSLCTSLKSACLHQWIWEFALLLYKYGEEFHSNNGCVVYLADSFITQLPQFSAAIGATLIILAISIEPL